MKRTRKRERLVAMLMAIVFMFSGIGMDTGRAYATQVDASVVETFDDLDVSMADVAADVEEEVFESKIDETIADDSTLEEANVQADDATDEEVAESSEELESEAIEQEVSEEAELGIEMPKLFALDKNDEFIAKFANWNDVLEWFEEEDDSSATYDITVDTSNEYYFDEELYKNGVIGELPDACLIRLHVNSAGAPINMSDEIIKLKGNLVIEGAAFVANPETDEIKGARFDVNGFELTFKAIDGMEISDIESVEDNTAKGSVVFKSTSEYGDLVNINKIKDIGEVSVLDKVTLVNNDSISAGKLYIGGTYVAAMCDAGEKGNVDVVEFKPGSGCFSFMDYDGKMSAKYDFTVKEFVGVVRVDKALEGVIDNCSYYPKNGSFPKGFKLFNYKPALDEDGKEIHPIGYAGERYNSGEKVLAGKSCFEYKNGSVYAKSVARALIKADWMQKLEMDKLDIFYHFNEEDGYEDVVDNTVYSVNTNPSEPESERTFKIYPFGGNGTATYTLMDPNAATINVEKIKNEETGIIESVATVVVAKNLSWDFDIKIQIDGITRTLEVIANNQNPCEGIGPLNPTNVSGYDWDTKFLFNPRFIGEKNLTYDLNIEKESGKTYYKAFTSEYYVDEEDPSYSQQLRKVEFAGNYSKDKGEYIAGPIDITIGGSRAISYQIGGMSKVFVPMYSCYYADPETSEQVEGRLVDWKCIIGDTERPADWEWYDGIYAPEMSIRLTPKTNDQACNLASNGAAKGLSDTERVFVQYQFGKKTGEGIVESVGPVICTDENGAKFYIIKGFSGETEEEILDSISEYKADSIANPSSWIYVPVSAFEENFAWKASVDINYNLGWEGDDDIIETYHSRVIYPDPEGIYGEIAAFAIVNSVSKNAMKLSDVHMYNDGYVYEQDEEGKDILDKPLGRWNWVDGDQINIQATNAARTQFYSAYFEPDENCPLYGKGPLYGGFQIAVSKLTGFEIEGRSAIKVMPDDSAEKMMVYGAWPVFVGYNNTMHKEFMAAVNSTFDISWSDKSNGKLVIKELAEVDLGDLGSDYSRSIYLPYSNKDTFKPFSTTISIQATSADGANKVVGNKNVQVVADTVDGILIRRANEALAIGANREIKPDEWKAFTHGLEEIKYEITNDNIYNVGYFMIDLDWNTIKANESDVIALEAYGPFDGASEDNVYVKHEQDVFASTKLSWSSDDKSIASVAAVKTDIYAHKSLVTIKKPGTTVITVKSTDKNAAEYKVLLNVTDHTPRLSTKVFNYSKYSSYNEVAHMYLDPNMYVYEAWFDESSPANIKNNLEFVVGEQGECVVQYKGETLSEKKASLQALSKGTFDKLKLHMVLKDNADESVQGKKYIVDGIKINITDKKPTLKMTQVGKVNLFYSSLREGWFISPGHKLHSAEDVSAYDLSPWMINNSGMSYKLNAGDADIRAIVVESPALKDTYKLVSVDEYDQTMTPEVSAYTGEPGYTFYYDYGQLNLIPVGLNADTLAQFKDKNSPVAKVKIHIYFNDIESDLLESIFNEDTAITKEIVVPVEEKKADLAFTTDQLYPYQNSTIANIIDNKTKELVWFWDHTSYMTEQLEVTNPVSHNGVLVAQNFYDLGDDEKEYADGFLITNTNKNYKTVSYKADIKSKMFTSVVTVKGKLTYAKKPVLKLKDSKVTVNMATNTADDGYIFVPLDIKNGNRNSIDKISYWVGAKDRYFMDDNILDVRMTYRYDSDYADTVPVLAVGIRQGADISKIKSGSTLKLNVKAKIRPDYDYSMYETDGTTLSIAFTDKAEEVSLKAKNSINVLDREKPMILVPTVKNTSAKVQNVVLTGKYANVVFDGWFNCDSNQLNISLRGGAEVSTNRTYDLGAVIYLTNGRKIVWDGVSKNQKISIKLTQKLPKVTPIVIGYADRNDENAYVNVVLAEKSDFWAQIEWPDMDFGNVISDWRILDYPDYNDNHFSFNLKTNSVTKAIKPGTYTIKLSYRFWGQAINTPSQTMTVKYTVK